jgi:glycosyltransferase involved in cell wall biosynthesis
MNVGGPAVQISGLMRGLDPDRYDHRLITGFCAPDEADYLETQAPDVPATRVSGLGRAIDARDDLRAFVDLKRIIREFDPHIIHTHTAKAGVVGRLAAITSKTDARLVHTFHGHLLHGYFSPTKTRAVIEVERRLAKKSTALVSVGQQVRDDLLAAGIGRANQFRIIPPGLSLPALPEKSGARAMFDLPEDAFVIAFVGRITQIKRPDRFLEVVRSVSKSSNRAHFLVAGAGDLAPMIEQAATKERLPITYLGWRSDIENILSASDAMLLTSDNEGTPLSLIQAGMAGLPVVSTNVGSVGEVVGNGSTGVLCDTDSHQLATALANLTSDPVRAAVMGARGHEFAEARFGVSRLVRDHNNLYEDILRS